ncbi:MAG: GGDEF domain-containing protein [Burkholderiales bacterium]|nr:GGDEF domain-containing protein [Burkholderiales bacterium]
MSGHRGLSFVLAFITMLGAGFGFVLAVLERNAEQMREMATHDGLTGCVNRITFDAMLLNALQRGLRSGEPVSLLMLDLDHFKAINDRYGHRAGDAVLRSFSDVVRTQLRASDTLARVGGEEFAVILPGTDAAGAAHVAESVREAVQSAAVDNQQGGVLRITISVGVACAQDGDGASADLLYQRADNALYQAKAAGRNRVVPASVSALPPAIEPA